jgi:hypothetical protein
VNEDILPGSLLGMATIDPSSPIVAGAYGTWRITYYVGSAGLASGGAIRIHTDSDTDWALPQFADPAAADYATVLAPEGAAVMAVVPGYRSILLRNLGRPLLSGERVTLALGDRTGGSPGSRCQTFAETRRFFAISVDAGGSGCFTALPDPPCVSIVGGPAIALVAVVPSVATTGVPFRLLVRAEDLWGNPANGYTGTVTLEAEGVVFPDSEYNFSPDEPPIWTVEGCSISRPGIYRIALQDTANSLAATSNPIQCIERLDEFAHYWGDPHGGQVVMAEKIAGHLRYARDVAGVDFAGHQRNDHEMSNWDWAIQQQTEQALYQPGRFVPLPGFEWSAETGQGGDHNIYFRRPGQALRRSGHEMVDDKSDEDTNLLHIEDVYRNYRGSDVVITPHVGGRTANLHWHEPSLEPAIEVTSTHGTFEWFLWEALDRGYQVGFLGGSDGYTVRPGAERPGQQERRYAHGGLTVVYARDLTIDGVLDAIKARRCYATTGARILLRFASGSHRMGEQYLTAAPPSFSVLVAGTAPLESVELWRGLERLHSHPLGWQRSRNRVRVTWEGASRRTSYAGVVWDGSLRLRGGRIAGDVVPLRFDSPRSYLRDVQPDAVAWHSVTCGYRSGIVFAHDGGPETTLDIALQSSLITGTLLGGHGDEPPRRISYAPMERVVLACRLADLVNGPKVIELGSLGRRVTLEMEPEGAPLEVEFAYTDPIPVPRVTPYWLRVLQTDGEMAWASPIFVEHWG